MCRSGGDVCKWAANLVLSVYYPTAHTTWIYCNANSHTKDHVNSWIRSSGFVFKIKVEKRTTCRPTDRREWLNVAVPGHGRAGVQIPGRIELYVTQIRQPSGAVGIGTVVKSGFGIDVVLIVMIPCTHVQILTTGRAHSN